jgi:hypothetical protein
MNDDESLVDAALDAAYDSRGKSAAQIEGDIDTTRAELAAVLGALEQRFAPRQLLERGLTMVSETLGGGVIGDTLRGNPVPLALIGAGIGWLLVAGATGEASAPSAAPAEPADESGPDPLYPAGEDFTGYAYARTKSAIADAAAAVDSASDAVAETIAQTKDGVARIVDKYPLALGLLGLLAGAALALSLPQSRKERGLVNGIGRSLRDLVVAAVSPDAAPGPAARQNDPA